MFRWIMLLCLLTGLALGSGCGKQSEPAPQEQYNLVLYSELDNKFTEELVQAFNKDYQNKIIVKAVYELPAAGAIPDLVLAEKRTLHGLKQEKRLQPVEFAAGDRLPQEFHDEDLCWYGVFYDPTVFLINQQFARRIGQSSLRGWSDLENCTDVRIVVENLSDSNSTQNFLAAFADHMGETISLNYLWNINRFVTQYAKFPFTPVRMTAVGDADLAITRQSYVFKYLENKFPAYVVMPEEGTPVNLYGAGVFKESIQKKQAAEFMEWLLAKDEVQKISLVANTGYLFLLPRGLEGPAAAVDKLWLNRSYLMLSAQEQLTDKWLEKVRFSK